MGVALLDRMMPALHKHNEVIMSIIIITPSPRNTQMNTFISSVRSSSGYHGLLEIRQQQATFSDFSNSSDSKVKVKVKGPNMCYIFEKHGIQGYRI